MDNCDQDNTSNLVPAPNEQVPPTAKLVAAAAQKIVQTAQAAQSTTSADAVGQSPSLTAQQALEPATPSNVVQPASAQYEPDNAVTSSEAFLRAPEQEQEPEPEPEPEKATSDQQIARPSSGASLRERLKDRFKRQPIQEPRSWFQRSVRALTLALTIWFGLVLVMIIAYRFVNPPVSNLMLYHYAMGHSVKHAWTPIENISPAVIKAVIVAEDAQFCRHWGIDFNAIERAIENAGSGTPRGASTISMQTAKNMFLWQSKSYVRKLLEVPVTLAMEIVWPKKRMLEIYLNIAEWGPGVFGIGAAARHHFGTSPKNLGANAAAQLAASLPNPKVRRAGRPGPKTRRKANVIRGRARHANWYTDCVLN